jgi:hypothetical protein
VQVGIFRGIAVKTAFVKMLGTIYNRILKHNGIVLDLDSESQGVTSSFFPLASEFLTVLIPCFNAKSYTFLWM